MIVLRHFCICIILFLAGCAVNPQMVSLQEPEESAARDLFRQTVDLQKKCSPRVDAEVNVILKSVFSSGSMDGYVQAMTPAYLKFVGINPFGQPLLAFSSDGERFQHLSFTDSRYYEGKVSAKSLAKYTPSGLELADGFYWLIGRIAPSAFNIIQAGGDELNRGYWVELSDPADGRKSRVLFDPEHQTILEHVLLDDNDNIVMRAEYPKHLPDECGLPTMVKITGKKYEGSLVMRFSDWRTDELFSRKDFILDVPVGFKRVSVQ